MGSTDYLRTQPAWLVRELRKTAQAFEAQAAFRPVPMDGWRVLMSDTLGDIIKGEVEVLDGQWLPVVDTIVGVCPKGHIYAPMGQVILEQPSDDIADRAALLAKVEERAKVLRDALLRDEVAR